MKKQFAALAGKGMDISKVYGNSAYHRVPVVEPRNAAAVARELSMGASGFGATERLEKSRNSKRSPNSKSSSNWTLEKHDAKNSGGPKSIAIAQMTACDWNRNIKKLQKRSQKAIDNLHTMHSKSNI